MKTTHTILFGLVAASAWLIAGSVTIPHTFQANTTAKAAEVNANFSAVKTAVDGNANDIATNEADIATNKADIAAAVTNISAGVGLSISRVDGNVTIKKKSGYVAVHGSAFNAHSEYGNVCAIIRNWRGNSMLGTYFSTTSTYADCSAFASVNIPNGATIKKLTCRVKHNYTGLDAGDVHVRLYMQNREFSLMFPPTTGNIQKNELIDITLAQADTSSDTQKISKTYSPPGLIVINPTYRSYFIEWDPPATNHAGSNEALFDCKVDYEY